MRKSVTGIRQDTERLRKHKEIQSNCQVDISWKSSIIEKQKKKTNKLSPYNVPVLKRTYDPTTATATRRTEKQFL